MNGWRLLSLLTVATSAILAALSIAARAAVRLFQLAAAHAWAAWPEPARVGADVPKVGCATAYGLLSGQQALTVWLADRRLNALEGLHAELSEALGTEQGDRFMGWMPKQLQAGAPLPAAAGAFVRRWPRLTLTAYCWGAGSARILIAGAMLVCCGTAAEAYCSAPSAPSCATRYGAFDDQDDFERCKRQMRSYQSEAGDFLACTRREADDLKRKSDDLINDYNSAVQSFNRRARG